MIRYCKEILQPKMHALGVHMLKISLKFLLQLVLKNCTYNLKKKKMSSKKTPVDYLHLLDYHGGLKVKIQWGWTQLLILQAYIQKLLK